jgi:disulfide bond formation protein DsbB
MTDPEAAKAMEAVAAATKGADTPEAASVVARPPEAAVKMLAWAGPALSVMIMSIGAALASAPAWRWLGLSMAGWNVLISLALATFSLLAAKRPKDARAPRIEKA